MAYKINLEISLASITFFLGGFIATLGSLFGILLFLKKLRKRRNEQDLIHRFGSEFYHPSVIKKVAKYYIKPDCSGLDPTQQAELRHVIITRQKLFEHVYKFLTEEHSLRHLLLLADSGMGKSSFMLNYYLHNQGLPKRKRQRIAIVPLGIPNADNYIVNIENKKDTVIFLDAFDEDTKAIKDHRQRLIELMQTCREFKQVVITCRTQFFTKDEEISRKPGIVKIKPRKPDDKREYKFWKLYLVPFTDQQVNEYLDKRYRFLRHDLTKAQ